MSYTRNCISCLLILFVALTCEAYSGFIGVNDAHFELNGSPFLFNGFNSYWLMHVAAEPAERYKVTEVLRDASLLGLYVCRTGLLVMEVIEHYKYHLAALNVVVCLGFGFCDLEAKKYGVRLILSFVNQWNDFGGKSQYVRWARNAGSYISSDDDFYTHPMLKTFYKNHIEKVVTRLNSITRVAYRDDPTIMAWELMNEPRDQADYSGKPLIFVKSLDNKHLLEVGMEGFYVGTDFISNHLINEIDFATIHAYTDQCDDAQLAWMERWITSHWKDSRTILKKPLVLAEFGKSSRGQGSRDTFMNSVYRNGSLVWQLMAHGMENYDDGYCIVLGQSPSTTQIISDQSHVMTALAHSFNQPH
ncbi:unnamed protein product [Withania somnifera]